MTAMCGMLTLSSCSTEEVINNTVAEPAKTVPEPAEGRAGSGTVGITTRGDTGAPLQTRLYIFNDAGLCIQLLSPDEHEQFVTTNLTTGTYDLYGMGSDELSNFILPTVDEATPTTEITVAAGRQRGDLLIGERSPMSPV